MILAASEIAVGKKIPCTYEEYRRLPQGSPYQLIGGEFVLTPAPGTYHQRIAVELLLQMAAHVKEKGLGLVLNAPVDVCLEETETYQPDLIYVSRDKMWCVEPERINGAPDLVVEILSPSTGYYDLRKKYRVYEKHGVREYWIVDPEEKSIQVFALEEGKFRLDQEARGAGKVRSQVIAGLAVDAQGIFA